MVGRVCIVFLLLMVLLEQYRCIKFRIRRSRKHAAFSCVVFFRPFITIISYLVLFLFSFLTSLLPTVSKLYFSRTFVMFTSLLLLFLKRQIASQAALTWVTPSGGAVLCCAEIYLVPGIRELHVWGRRLLELPPTSPVTWGGAVL